MLDIFVQLIAKSPAGAETQFPVLPVWSLAQPMVETLGSALSLPLPLPLPLPENDLSVARLSFSRTLPLAEAIVRIPENSPESVVAAPLGWQALEVAPGIIAYTPPLEEQVTVAVAMPNTELIDLSGNLSEDQATENAPSPTQVSSAFDDALQTPSQELANDWGSWMSNQSSHSSLDGESEHSSTSSPESSEKYSILDSLQTSSYRSKQHSSNNVISDDQFVDPYRTIAVRSSRHRSIDAFDGTRHPYVSELGMADLLAHPIAPGKYLWSDVWQGEGYDRGYDPTGKLVAGREQGANIHVHVAYDATIRDPKVVNLRIIIESQQDQTAQVTNLSAFLRDPQTGEAIARRDFPQLAPVYEITLTKNGGFSGTEVQILEPLGVVTFAYHLAKDELHHNFPLKLQADNRQFQQRQLEIFELQTQGWEVREVPPPSWMN